MNKMMELVSIVVGRDATRSRLHLAVAMTCHNRLVKTLECLEFLFAAADLIPDLRLTVHLVDDGSSDGTGTCIRAKYPRVRVIDGSGNLYWNGGMRIAMADAMLSGPDAILWLNDDVRLFLDSIERMLKFWLEQRVIAGHDVVVVGAMCDPETGVISYGGLKRKSWLQPLRFLLMPQSNFDSVPCDTMNGNCVLIPRSVFLRIGNLDSGFLHSMGDIDYGLRCAAAGYQPIVLSNFAGECFNDHKRELPNLHLNSFRAHWKNIKSFRMFPPAAWWLFCIRHGGVIGVIVFVKTYVFALLRGIATGRLA